MICVHPSEFEWQGAHKVGLLWQRSFYMISSVVRDGRHFMVHLKIKGAPHCHYQPHKVPFPLLQLAKSVSGWVASERWERQLKTEVMSNTRNDQMMRLIDAFVLNHFVKYSLSKPPFLIKHKPCVYIPCTCVFVFPFKEGRPVKYWAFISKLVSVVPLYHCILWLAMPK